MTMIVQAMAVVGGLLMAGAAVAADDRYTLFGTKITVDTVSGVIQCTGGCTVKFSKPFTSEALALKPYRTEASELSADLAKTGFRAINLRLTIDSMRYEVNGQAEINTGADGLSELKAEEIRVTKVPAAL
jgi:hypothetical protein